MPKFNIGEGREPKSIYQASYFLPRDFSNNIS